MDLKNKLLFLFLLINSLFLYGNFPEISSDNSNLLYKQLQADINENNKRIIEKKSILPIQFYYYSIKKNDSIFSIAARFNLTYDTIATLNNIDNQLFFNDLDRIIVPNCPGIYLNNNYNGNGIKIENFQKTLYFFPGQKFDGADRLNFLVTPFISPLKKMIITSEFGYRENPFTMKKEFHQGMDLKASENTIIYSPLDGVIIDIKTSSSFGLMLVIQHSSGYTSHFYHLNSIFFNIGDSVEKGEKVGLTGNSGKSTGPHLHYEIHINGEPIDPKLIFGNV